MPVSTLNEKELFHFALHCSKQGQADQSIIYLKQLLQENENHAEAHFLIGSEYAEILMVNEGIEHMRKALELVPEAHLVRFQMSMLLFATQKHQECKENLAPLLEIDDTVPFKFFATGITALIEDDKDTAIENIKTGLSFELNNPALQNNLTGLLNAIESGSATEEVVEEQASSTGEMFLSAYKN